jgi:hypothetical protein
MSKLVGGVFITGDGLDQAGFEFVFHGTSSSFSGAFGVVGSWFLSFSPSVTQFGVAILVDAIHTFRVLCAN